MTITDRRLEQERTRVERLLGLLLDARDETRNLVDEARQTSVTDCLNRAIGDLNKERHEIERQLERDRQRH
jgi:hypothetical protein